jgi:hypothetical protein
MTNGLCSCSIPLQAKTEDDDEDEDEDEHDSKRLLVGLLRCDYLTPCTRTCRR